MKKNEPASSFEEISRLEPSGIIVIGASAGGLNAFNELVSQFQNDWNAFDLRNLIHKVHNSKQPAKKSGLEINHNGSTHQVSIEAIPITSSDEGEILLVVFDETGPSIPTAIDASFAKDKLVQQLRTVIDAFKQDMASIVETLEVSNEELQSASEEVVSSNEELQSINEEMETSKEEIESTNEELLTMNHELQVRNDQLAESYDYSEAVIATIRESVLVLDSHFRIRNANRAFYKTFQVKEAETEEVVLYDLQNGEWNIPDLHELLEGLLPRNSHIQGYRIKHVFSRIGEKIMVLNVRKIVQKIHRQEYILIAIEDITEHETAQQIIAEREEWFRNMANNAPVMIWVSQPDKKRTFLNRTWLEFTGRKMEEEIGDGWMENIHKDDVGQYLEIYNASMEKQQPFEAEYRLRHHDGEYRWVKVHAKPTYSVNNTYVGYVGSVLDIQDQKDAEYSLKEAADRVEEILGSLPHMAWMADTNGKLIFVNKGYTAFTGLTLMQVQSQSRSDLIHPDDVEAAYKLRDKHFKEGTPYDFKVRYKRKEDGMYRWHLVRAVPLKDNGGKITAWVGTNTDIHDEQSLNELLLESTEKLRAALDGLPQMAWITDEKGNLHFVNKGYSLYTGQNENEVISFDHDSIHAEDSKKFLSKWRQHLKSGEPIELEVRYKRASDGMYRWHLLRATAIKNAKGNITSWVGTNTDIHEQKMFFGELERRVQQRTYELQEANVNLERSNNELEQFAYVASHDLQEPLRKILTFSDRLQERFYEVLPPDAKGYIDKIATSADRMTKLIDDLLNFSRASAINTGYEPVDLNKTLENVLKDFDVTIGNKNAKINCERLPVIEAIPVQMVQLFHNLLSNALKFVYAERPPEIFISAQNFDSKELINPGSLNHQTEYCEIVVRDNGIGFHSAYADQIFIIFQRLNENKNYPGTGIGLALCRKIVSNHGGKIYAESREKEGSSFHVILPLKQS
ncbi:MAG: PAS domain S-box protein [Chitinophagales bacterium]|nr:PAS domain S-box protein [Chitinophagales bacterium]